MSAEHDVLIRKLLSIGKLSREEQEAVRRMPLTVRTILRDSDMAREGKPSDQCSLILEGFVYRYKILPDGQRQIMSFHIPGDIPDLQNLFVEVMDHSLGTLKTTKVAFIAHHVLRDLIRDHPGVAALLWRDTLVDAAIFREWLTGVGRRSAHQRIAHLLCEVFARMDSVGLTGDRQFQFPVTQSQLADSLGLSTVHVNRVLQDLKREGLIAFKSGNLFIANMSQLHRAGDFDPTYLQIAPGHAGA